MMRNQDPIIIKRQTRRTGEQKGGGGAWKVAFADFTMAMMSLFLVLWLLSVTEKDERQAVASSLRNYSVFDDKSGNPFALSDNSTLVDLVGKPKMIDQVAQSLIDHSPARTADDRQRPPQPHRASSTQAAEHELASILDTDLQTPEDMQLMAKVVDSMAKKLSASNNLNVEVVPQGLRITIQDDKHRQMFLRGSVKMNPFFEDLLMSLAPVFSHIKNEVVISGHTDSVPYQNKHYTNWALSGDRALVARRALSAGGMPSDRVVQVIAMADRFPVDQQDTKASANRRIEILILNDQTKQQLHQMFDRNNQNNVLDKASRAAEKNQPVTR